MVNSGRAKRETAKGRNRTRNAHFRRFLQIFADFRLALQIKGFGSRRFAQKTAGNRRSSQETADFCRNRFLPFVVSLLARSYITSRDQLLSGAHLRQSVSGEERDPGLAVSPLNCCARNS